MKKYSRIFSSFFIVFLCVGAFAACTSTCKSKRSLEINHYLTYSQKGSRSEARHGHCTVDGREVPDVFTLIVSYKRAFKFYQRKHIWGNDGYHMLKNITLIEESKQTINEDQIKRGWYISKQRLKNTPIAWIYVEWETSNAFISPKKINEFIKNNGLKNIPRVAGLDTLK